jgi:spermidine synthase
MKNWKLLGEASIPGSERTLQLLAGKDDFFIKISGIGGELMNTRKHASEDALGRLPCELIPNPNNARVLIGGLGMGFTLAAALATLPDSARVTVAELVPEVVEWNRGPLGAAAGRPLNDPRVTVHQGDVADLLKQHPKHWDVIAMDVDNGPEGLTQADNDALYQTRGILSAMHALTPNGILAYWSAGPDPSFRERLKRCGLVVKEKTVFAHGNKGARHTIWLAN